MPRGDSVVQAVRSSWGHRSEARAPLPLTAEELVWFAGSICRLSGVAFDANVVRQRLGPSCDVQALVAVLEGLGFDVADGAAARVPAAPAIAVLDPQAQPAVVLVVRVAADAVDVAGACGDGSARLTRREFERRCKRWLGVRLRVDTPVDLDAGPERARFGFPWFFAELLKHRRIWRDVLLASLAIQLLALGVPLMTQAIIDKVIVHRTEATLIALGSGLALFALFTAVLTWARQYLLTHTGTRIDAVLGACVFEHLIRLSPRYFERRPTGVIAARLHGVEQIREFLSSAAVALVLDLPFLSICLALMFVYSLPLTLLVLAFLALIVLASIAVGPVFQVRLDREFLLGARSQAFVTEYVAGIETVKSLQMEPMLTRRFGDYLAAHLAAAFATRQVANTYQVAAGTLEQAMSLSILVMGAWIVMQPHLDAAAVFTVGMLVAFQMFASRLSQPLMRLVGLWQQFQQAHIAVRRLGDVMNAPAEPCIVLPARMPRDGVAADAASAPPLIRFEALAFRYGDDRRFLFEGLDLSIRAGQSVAVVGPSGCGKSTLVKLLQGFYLPTRGRIVVDGIDARHLAANELRATFGVVPQETVLFAGSVLDNLLLAHPHASFADVVHACRLAGIHDAIEQMPQGYRTGIGERGTGLSGGQRQRIAIARALLKRPRVLVFDEATSHLDAQTELAVAATLQSLRGRVTLLFITHAPIDRAAFDQVVVLGSATVREDAA
jgi:subfamily B ATP-binding cassette protein HlyB/CyaB